MRLIRAVCYSSASDLLIPRTEATNYSQPISPDIYSTLIAQGFATNWFKSPKRLKKYRDDNIGDVYNATFRNLRLRSRVDIYSYPYNTSEFTSFLIDLEKVVDKCLSVGVVPIVSWIHHEAEAYATEEDRENYITWWTKVADKLKNKDYRLGLNLFNELGGDVCQHTNNCELSLSENITKYNTWTFEAVQAIRGTGGNNGERILILSSPTKTSKGLVDIDSSIYENDDFMMVEWHTYASGPNKTPGSSEHWEGNGSDSDRQNLLDAINRARNFTLKSYFGGWMPQDKKRGELNQTEVENFARYFVSVLKNENIPWSLNVLDVHYETKTATWRTEIQTINGQPLNMSTVLDVIKEHM